MKMDFDCSGYANMIGQGYESRGGNYYEGWFQGFVECFDRQQPL